MESSPPPAEEAPPAASGAEAPPTPHFQIITPGPDRILAIPPTYWHGQLHTYDDLSFTAEHYICADLIRREQPAMICDLLKKSTLFAVWPELARTLTDRELERFATARAFLPFSSSYQAGFMLLFPRKNNHKDPPYRQIAGMGETTMTEKAQEQCKKWYQHERSNKVPGFCYFRHQLMHDTGIVDVADTKCCLPADYQELVSFLRSMQKAKVPPPWVICEETPAGKEEYYALCPYANCTEQRPRRLRSDLHHHVRRHHLGGNPRLCREDGCETWYPDNQFGRAAYQGHLRWEHKVTLKPQESFDKWLKLPTLTQLQHKMTGSKYINAKGEEEDENTTIVHPERTISQQLALVAIRDSLYYYHDALWELCDTVIHEKELEDPRFHAVPAWYTTTRRAKVKEDNQHGALRRDIYHVLGRADPPDVNMAKPYHERARRPASSSSTAHDTTTTTASRAVCLPSFRPPAPTFTICVPTVTEDPPTAWVQKYDHVAPQEVSPTDMNLRVMLKLQTIMDNYANRLVRGGEYEYARALGPPVRPRRGHRH